jgi:hypothetical protein
MQEMVRQLYKDRVNLRKTLMGTNAILMVRCLLRSCISCRHVPALLRALPSSMAGVVRFASF